MVSQHFNLSSDDVTSLYITAVIFDRGSGHASEGTRSYNALIADVRDMSSLLLGFPIR